MSGGTLILKRSNASIRVWDARERVTPILLGNDETQLTLVAGQIHDYYVEWWNTNSADKEAFLDLFYRRPGKPDIHLDGIRFYPFNTIVVAIGGFSGVPQDPAPQGYGIFDIGIRLYDQGYDVHMYSNMAVANDGLGEAYDEVKSAVQKRGVGTMAVMGHSYGGGAARDLAFALIEGPNKVAGLTVAYSAYIDAVKNGLPLPENAVPSGTRYHVNFYQNIPVCGMSFPASKIDINVRTWALGKGYRTHMTMDDNPNLKNLIIDHLMSTKGGRAGVRP